MANVPADLKSTVSRFSFDPNAFLILPGLCRGELTFLRVRRRFCLRVCRTTAERCLLGFEQVWPTRRQRCVT